MRTLSSRLVIALLGAITLTTTAHAGPYTASEAVCQSAISARLGLDTAPAEYTLQNVHNKMQYRDFKYVVSATDSASTVKDVNVTCRVRKTGSLMALTFDPDTAPVSVARQ